MIKNALLASAALAVLSTAAVAADLPSRRAPPVYVAPVLPVFSWTGFYLGATAGYAFNGDDTFNTTIASSPVGAALLATGGRPAFVRDRASGFTGGGEIGYNYEFLNTAYFGGGGGVVVGIEADAEYVGSGANAGVIGNTGLLSTYHSRTDYVGTVRGRLGYAFDNFLVYGTGGFAYGGVHENQAYLGAASGLFSGATSSMRTGYAYGGGVAYAIPTTSFLNFFHSSAVTLKAEFIHYDLGTNSLLVLNTGTGVSYTSSIKTQGNLARAGIDYKFDFTPPAAVVARY